MFSVVCSLFHAPIRRPLRGPDLALARAYVTILHMGTPTEPNDRFAKALAVAVRRMTIMNVLLALLVLGGFAGSAYALLRPAARSSAQPPTPQATVTATETVAFQSILVATQAPTRTPQTPTATPTVTLTPTLSPTPSVTPSPTRTPIPPKNDVTRLVIPAIKLDTKVVTVGITERYKKGVVERV